MNYKTNRILPRFVLRAKIGFYLYSESKLCFLIGSFKLNQPG